MNREKKIQPGANNSNATMTPAERNAAESEVLNREWNSLCENCEESAWNDCNRCVAKTDRMIKGMTDRIEQLEQTNELN